MLPLLLVQCLLGWCFCSLHVAAAPIHRQLAEADAALRCLALVPTNACPNLEAASALSSTRLPEVCREPADDKTYVEVANCIFSKVDVLPTLPPDVKWFLHMPQEEQLRPPLVLGPQQPPGPRPQKQQHSLQLQDTLPREKQASSNAESSRPQPGEPGTSRVHVSPTKETWPSPAIVVLGFAAGPGAHFVDGEFGSVFNETHAFTNKRWHRTPTRRCVARTFTAPTEPARCVLNSAALAAVQHQRDFDAKVGGVGEIVRVKGVLVNLVIAWGETFQHTVLDVLPRLAAFIYWLQSDAQLPNSNSNSNSSNSSSSSSSGRYADDNDAIGGSEAAHVRRVLRNDPTAPVTILINRGSRFLRHLLSELQLQPGFPLRTSWRLVDAQAAVTYTADVVLFPTLAGQARIGVMPPHALCPLMAFLHAQPHRTQGPVQEVEQQQEEKNAAATRPGVGRSDAALFAQGIVAPTRRASSHGEGEGEGEGEKLVLFLSRGEHHTRSMVPSTEAALITAMQEHIAAEGGPGWALHVWDHNAAHSWQEDRRLFARARVVVGPHGGAFANLIFIPPSPPNHVHVVEFIPRESILQPPPNGNKRGSYFRPCFYSLARALGFTYYQVEPTAFSFDKQGVDIDVQDVLDILSHIFASSNATHNTV